MNEADGEQMKEMIGKIAEGVRELADIIRDFISDGGIEKILDFFGWIADNGDKIVSVLGLIAGAWGIEKIKKFGEGIEKLGTNLNGLISSLGAAAEGAGALSLSLNSWLIIAGLAITAAATLKLYIDSSAAALWEHPEPVNDLDDEYKELNKTLEDFNKLKEESISLAAQEALANKENADKAVKQYEYQASSLEKMIEKNREYYGGELTDDTMLYYFDQSGNKMGEAGTYGDKMDELGSTYHNLYAARDIANAYDSAISEEASTGRQRDAAEMSKSNAGNTNEDALSEVWDGIRKRTDEKMKELDDLLATHQITEEEYWARRKEWLEAHRDEESKEWWEYYDEVTEYYDKAAKTEETAANKAADSAEKTAVNNVKKTMENLKRIQQEQGLSDEWLMKQYKLLADSLEKGTDAYYAAYDAYLDMRDKVRDENDRQAEEDRRQREKAFEDEKKDAEKRLDELDKQHDKEVKQKKKEAEDNLKLLEKTQKDYAKSGSEMSERVKDDKGKERLVLQDYNKEAKKLKKYRESMDKLKALGLSEELIESVNSFSYEDGSRQLYIDELLKMRPEKRGQYDKEYQEYIAEQKKTAEYDTGLSFEDEEKSLLDASNGVLDEASEKAYEYGKKAGELYIKGMEDIFNSGGVIEAVTMKNPAAVQTNKNVSTPAAVDGGNVSGKPTGSTQGISPKTAISINIAGTSVIRTTLEELLRENILTGGAIRYV